MQEMFTEQARRSIEYARDEASRLRHDYIGTDHLLLGLIRLGEGIAADILVNLGLELDELKGSIEEVVQPSGGTMTMGQLPLTARAKKTLEESGQEARKHKSKDIDTEHILLALLRDEEGVAAQVLSTYEIDYKEADAELRNIKAGKPSSVSRIRKRTNTPALDHFGSDLTALARRGKLDLVVGREREVENVAQVLSRRNRNNPLLIGDPGIGKRSIVRGLAQMIVDKEFAHSLERARLVSLDVNAMTTLGGSRDQLRTRLNAVREELGKAQNLIVFVEDFQSLAGLDHNEFSTEFSKILRPLLLRAQTRCISSSSVSVFRGLCDDDPALAGVFQVINIEPPSAEETIKIIKSLRPEYEEHHRVQISDEAIEAAVTLSELYLPRRHNPSKSLQLVDEAAALVSMKSYHRPEEIEKLDREMGLIQLRKEDAVKNQAFQTAAQLRDDLKEMRERRITLEKEWEQKRETERIVVESEAVQIALGRSTGLTPEQIGQREGVPKTNVIRELAGTAKGVPVFERKQAESVLHGESVEISPGTGFVLLPHVDEFREIYKYAIRPAMEANGLVVKKAEDIYRPGSILAQVWQEILTSEVIVADVSDRNPNVIYELGLCYGVRRCPILLVRDPSELPFNLRSLRYIEYKNTASGTADLKDTLSACIEEFLAASRSTASQ